VVKAVCLTGDHPHSETWVNTKTGTGVSYMW